MYHTLKISVLTCKYGQVRRSFKERQQKSYWLQNKDEELNVPNLAGGRQQGDRPTPAGSWGVPGSQRELCHPEHWSVSQQ